MLVRDYGGNKNLAIALQKGKAYKTRGMFTWALNQTPCVRPDAFNNLQKVKGKLRASGPEEPNLRPINYDNSNV